MAGFWDKRLKAIAPFKSADAITEDWEKRTVSFSLSAPDKPLVIKLAAFNELAKLLGSTDITLTMTGDNRYADEGDHGGFLQVSVASVVFPDFDKKG